MNDPVTVVVPGSFDPITVGHEDIVRRSLRFADRVIVAVAHRASQEKRGVFTVAERVEMIRDTFAGEERIEAAEFSGLLVEYALERGARIIVRGLRAVSDFEYEFQLALMNREMRPEIETVFLAPDAQHSFLSASLVREIASLGGDVAAFVPPPVLRRLRERFG
ncbi:MAG: pantetheine-phosphate adenylyltransferase [Longimicrobiaceae bacterium]|jgi:pantetheine-phosphate adenylyltransferase